MIKIGAVDGPGYAFGAKLHLLRRHLQAEVLAINSREGAGMLIANMCPIIEVRNIRQMFTVDETAGLCQLPLLA